MGHPATFRYQVGAHARVYWLGRDRRWIAIASTVSTLSLVGPFDSLVVFLGLCAVLQLGSIWIGSDLLSVESRDCPEQAASWPPSAIWARAISRLGPLHLCALALLAFNFAVWWAVPRDDHGSRFLGTPYPDALTSFVRIGLISPAARGSELALHAPLWIVLAWFAALSGAGSAAALSALSRRPRRYLIVPLVLLANVAVAWFVLPNVLPPEMETLRVQVRRGFTPQNLFDELLLAFTEPLLSSQVACMIRLRDFYAGTTAATIGFAVWALVCFLIVAWIAEVRYRPVERRRADG